MAQSSQPCTLTLDDGTHYDLSSLSSAKSDYVATVGEREYKLNVCRAVVGELWKVDDPELVGGYTNRTRGDFSLGQYNDTLLLSEATNQPIMYMKQGSPCTLNPLTAASTAVRFVCSPNDFHSGKPVLIAAMPPGDPENYCQFFFEWHTHVACPTNPKTQLESGHYIAFGSILFIAILTWFLGHTFYNRLYLKRRGLDQFPLPSPSSFPNFSIPSLPKIGSLSLSRNSDQPKPAFGWRRSQQRRGYSHIRAEEDDEEDGFAGRFSLEDDDEEGPGDLTAGVIRENALGGEADAWRSGGQKSTGGNSGRTRAEERGLVDL